MNYMERVAVGMDIPVAVLSHDDHELPLCRIQITHENNEELMRFFYDDVRDGFDNIVIVVVLTPTNPDSEDPIRH